MIFEEFLKTSTWMFRNPFEVFLYANNYIG